MATIPPQTINKTAYTLIAQGACVAESSESMVKIGYIITATDQVPDPSSTSCMNLRKSLSYTGTEFVWMILLKSKNSTTEIKVTEVV